MSEGKKTGTFKSLDGKEYTITGFTRMMAIRIEEAVKANWELTEGRSLPKQPTYKIDGDDTFGNEEIVFYHTEETLYEPLTKEQLDQLEKNPSTNIERKFLPEITKREQAAWRAFQSISSELDSRIWKQMMYEAMNCVVVPMNDLKEYAINYSRATGLSIPDPEKFEARVKRLFVEEVVLCDNTDEMMRLLTETMRIAGVISEEEASVALDSFRNQTAKPSSKPAERQNTVKPSGDS